MNRKGQGTRDKGQEGFTLLLAALVASVVLALGTSIFALAQKELQLSSVGRDSQFAFYTADSAAECALFWDIRYTLFATSSPPASVTCDAQTASVTVQTQQAVTTFTYQYESGGLCAKVSVAKQDTHPRTTIHANGYNTSCADIISSASRALERSVELRY